MLVFCKKCLVLCKLLSHLHNVQERCLCLIRSVPYLIETRFILPSKWQRLGDLLFHWLISDTWRRISGVFPQSGLNFLTKGQRQLSCMHRYNSSSACTIPSQGALRSGIMSLLSSLPEVISYEGWSKERPVVLFFPEFCDGLFQLLNQMEVCPQAAEYLIFLDSLRCQTGGFISRFHHHIYWKLCLNEQRWNYWGRKSLLLKKEYTEFYLW